MKIILDNVTNIDSITTINANFDKIEQELQNKILYRDNPVGEPNTLENDLDVNGKTLYNVGAIDTVGGLFAPVEVVQALVDEAESYAEDALTNANSAAADATIANARAISANTSATNAGNSATAAANSASAASTSATNASNSATAASGSATTAGTAASTATTQAGIATTQAGIATTQAGISTTQAGIATTAANNAAASYDSFDDRYLGPKASDPTLDNDGNALLVGAIYFNTTISGFKVWSGTVWIIATTLVGTAIAQENLTFSPRLTFGGTPGSITAQSSSGVYTKIGNIITFHIKIDITTKGANTGVLIITGMPYSNQANGILNVHNVSGGFTQGFVGLTGRPVCIQASNSVNLELYQANATTEILSSLTDANVNNATQINISGTYQCIV